MSVYVCMHLRGACQMMQMPYRVYSDPLVSLQSILEKLGCYDYIRLLITE